MPDRAVCEMRDVHYGRQLSLLGYRDESVDRVWVL